MMFTVIFSYYSMSDILTNKLHDSIQSNLQQVRLSMENTIDDLNYVSQQIAYSENIVFKLNAYLVMEQGYQRAKYYDDVKKELNLITFSNPNIGLSLVYMENDRNYLFNSHGVKEGFRLRNDPLLIEGYEMHNFGPHVSMERYNEGYVLSTIRQLNITDREDIYVYLESNFDLTKNLLREARNVDETSYLLVDDANKVIYSGNKQFTYGTSFLANSNVKAGKEAGHYWFREVTSRGWSIIALIPIAEYQQEVNHWVKQMIYFAILFVSLSLIIALLLWKTLYKPLNQFNNEIHLMKNNNFTSEVIQTNIPEFRELTTQFRHMKKQIASLINEIEHKERKRADLEVEKLVHQINPHFLMNTLDTARWLVVSGDKKEATNLLTSLNKILYYNMGKLGFLSTLEEELDSMEQYIKLQQIRYDFEYSLHASVPQAVLHSPVPRFILQPIVENAIYHGLVDEGNLEIEIRLADDMIILKVKDDGRGMPKEKVDAILAGDSYQQSKNGMGIGLNYVKRILERTYAHKATITMESKMDEGTIVILRIPYIKGGSTDD
ncbi:sensor histidine kinase [Gracilibacillus oryzae]|uniref:histidine kinase n=2 Tax=Gracilibacillus oryzae TaxID=1672701 RepID=A0A7C8KXJ6_9BACI|nr:sensor histidine kinase [Gracilibacillus oryzae]